MSPDKIVVFCCICCILSESGMMVAARMIILVTRMVEPWIRMRILVTRMIEPWTRTIRSFQFVEFSAFLTDRCKGDPVQLRN